MSVRRETWRNIGLLLFLINHQIQQPTIQTHYLWTLPHYKHVEVSLLGDLVIYLNVASELIISFFQYHRMSSTTKTRTNNQSLFLSFFSKLVGFSNQVRSPNVYNFCKFSEVVSAQIRVADFKFNSFIEIILRLSLLLIFSKNKLYQFKK